jgi:hypothetical protein
MISWDMLKQAQKILIDRQQIETYKHLANIFTTLLIIEAENLQMKAELLKPNELDNMK